MGQAGVFKHLLNYEFHLRPKTQSESGQTHPPLATGGKQRKNNHITMKTTTRELPTLPDGYWVIGRTGSIRIAANLVDASAPLLYADSEEHQHWRQTPYQTADASHNALNARRLVKDWLRSQG